MSLGVLTAYVLGTFFTWDDLAWTCCGVAISLTIVVITLPRSPVWLRSKNKIKEADKAAEWLGLECKNKNGVSLNVIEKGRSVGESLGSVTVVRNFSL